MHCVLLPNYKLNVTFKLLFALIMLFVKIFFFHFVLLSVTCLAKSDDDFSNDGFIYLRRDRSSRFPFIRALVSSFIADRTEKESYPHRRNNEFMSADSSRAAKSQSMESIIEDIHDSEASPYLGSRRFFLTTILSRMLRAVNITEVSSRSFISSH